MKIIFLDIDGVLNTQETFEQIYLEYKKNGKRRLEIDTKKVEYLKEIVEQTGALLVLASSWKIFFAKQGGKVLAQNSKYEELLKILQNYNLFIYDTTYQGMYQSKAKEIKDWLKNNEVESFIILDDETEDLGNLAENYLIKTRFSKNAEEELGLCKKHIIQAVDMLNYQKQEKFIQRKRK